ncbi:MAG: DeoR/GlpR transcriptional regulator [Clostridia bacterium]|nr:DeoR/GlpR transcriptional regulator [Clostridia bacterium]
MNQDRRNQIVKMLNKQHTISNSELMETFKISIETVRRDLAYLEKQGLLERVYGGAVKKNFMNTEPEYTNRQTENLNEKQAIAKEAEKLIELNDTLFFDIGTTTLALAENLNNSKNIKAFTNSLRVATSLSEKGCEVIVTGGKVRNGEFSVSGFIAENNMNQFNFDKAIIGVAGIDENGITDFIPEEANLRKQIIKNSRKTIVLADYTKFGVRAICNIAPLCDIDILITDEKAPYDLIKKFEKIGINVIIAKI